MTPGLYLFEHSDIHTPRPEDIWWAMFDGEARTESSQYFLVAVDPPFWIIPVDGFNLYLEEEYL